MSWRFPLGQPDSRAWVIRNQLMLWALMALNGYLLWHNWHLSVQFDALMGGARHIYDYAADRCLGRGV